MIETDPIVSWEKHGGNENANYVSLAEIDTAKVIIRFATSSIDIFVYENVNRRPIFAEIIFKL